MMASDDEAMAAPPLTANEPSPAWALCVETDDEAPVTVPLAKPRYVIGRGAESDLRLDERTVSRRHAVLTRDEAGVWWADDAGSAHGTYVNGRLVGERVPLGHGACVQAGDVLVTLRDVTGAATGALPGRFEPVARYLRVDPATEHDGGVRLRRVAADAPARLVLLRGPGVGTVLRLDDGPVTLGGVAGSTWRLEEPGCEAVEVVVRPVAGQGFEVVRRGGPVKVYVSVQGYERRLVWNNDVVRLVHDDGRLLSEVRLREAGAGAAACLPGTPLPVGTGVDALPPSWAHWLRRVTPKPTASAEADGSTEALRADATPVPAPRPSGRDEGGVVSARRARRTAWAVLAASLALVVAMGVWLGTRGPSAPAPDVATGVPAARSTFEVRSAAVEPTVEPTVEGPASPGAALATTERVPAGGAAGARRSAVMGAPKAEEPEVPLNANDDARLRARVEARMKAGHASANELFQLRKLCVRRGDIACLGRLDSFARQRSELAL